MNTEDSINGEATPNSPPSVAVRFQKSSCNLKGATIMVVDDEPLNIKVLQKHLRGGGYDNIIGTSDPREVVELIRTSKPDVVLLDVMMPEVSGLDILEAVSRDPALQFVPIVIVTASDDAVTKLRALELGATDFLSKPVDPNDLLPRVRNALTVRAYQEHLEGYSARLAAEVEKRTEKLEASRTHVMHCLARAGEYRDDVTGNHVIRVGLYGGVVARRLNMNSRRVAILEHAGQLHDVGKIGIPDAILHKPGKLTPAEFKQMEKHCEMGRDIILATPIDGGESGHDTWTAKLDDVVDSESLTMAAIIAMSHHEKWDGSGYPCGLAGNDIPIEGRVIAIADVYDALGSARPYKTAFPREKCLDIIREGRGTHFDPQVADAFFDGLAEVVEIEERCRDERQNIDVAA